MIRMGFAVYFCLFIMAVPIASQSSSCGPGFYLRETVCKKCPLGSYCPDGKKQIQCPPGSYTDLYEQIACRRCPTGYYNILPGAASCIKCFLDYQCANSSSLPKPCATGYYSPMYAQTTCRRLPRSNTTIHIPGCFNVNG
jgi:hypothetical protein